jgi:hypothetical protein
MNNTQKINQLESQANTIDNRDESTVIWGMVEADTNQSITQSLNQ